MPRVTRECHEKGGEHGGEARPARDFNMHESRGGQIALHHQEKANGSGFDGLMPAQSEAELVMLVKSGQ